MPTGNPTPCTPNGKCSTRWPVHYVDLCEQYANEYDGSTTSRVQLPVHLISFASSEYTPSLKRLTRQAKEMNAFTSISMSTEEDLAPSFREQLSEYLRPGVRGYGFWMWKPELILRTLERIPDGEVLLYLDAGCHLNPAGRARFHQYVQWVATGHSGLLAFQYRSFSSAPRGFPIERAKDLTDRQYTKREALQALKTDLQNPLLDDPAIAGGILFIRKCSESTANLRLWRNVIETHPSAFTDELDISVQDSSFRDTRHDQSILSIHSKMLGIETVSAYETWVPKSSKVNADWTSLGGYPIHARRDLGHRAFSKYGVKRMLRGLGRLTGRAC